MWNYRKLSFEEAELINGMNPSQYIKNAWREILDQLFITLEHRGKGIGKKLFTIAAHQAREWGAEKLYICAGSAEETIAFYGAMGCREAAEVSRKLLENDPRDVQLEFVL